MFLTIVEATMLDEKIIFQEIKKEIISENENYYEVASIDTKGKRYSIYNLSKSDLDIPKVYDHIAEPKACVSLKTLETDTTMVKKKLKQFILEYLKDETIKIQNKIEKYSKQSI